jgi:hypothetical protein
MRKSRLIGGIFIAAILLTVGGYLLIAYLGNNILQSYKRNYVQPDTTIVIRNGVPDTTITIKQLPAWLK